MHRTFLGHLETGRKDFRLTTVVRVAHALGITLQELFTGIEAGEAFKSRRKTDRADTEAMRRELAAMERSVQRLTELASPRSQPSVARPRPQKQPARKSKRG